MSNTNDSLAEKRLELLRSFHKALERWFHAKYEPEGETALRSYINRNSGPVRKAVSEAGMLKLLNIAPPPAIGGVAIMNVDPFQNLFHDFYGSSVIPTAMDSVEQAIGVFEDMETEEKPVTLMSDQQQSFTYTNLEWKLREQLNVSLRSISALSNKDVLSCDSACLTEIIRQFAVAPPILRSDLMTADEEIIESVDITVDRERKTGHTNHSFFIPVEREADWLEEVDRQMIDSYPLAFLDRERSRITIILMISPEDPEGRLKRELDHRKRIVEQYVDSVAERIIEFNKDLADKMTEELNKRKNALVKAERELENVGLPRVYNPEHVERAIKIERLLGSLGGYMTRAHSHSGKSHAPEIRSFIVHGHDELALLNLKNYLQNTLGLSEPVVLREMPGLGKTMIEKFEREAEVVDLVFVLLTPDDGVRDPLDPQTEKRRARQNVILELGFFLGKLGRGSGKILLLHKGPVEIPSDIIGIEYIDISNGIESAGEKIRRELQPLGVLK